jgi:hypothetical protein
MSGSSLDSRAENSRGPTKRRILHENWRNGLRAQPAYSVRGSSRRIMSLRFQPANISVINRRASPEAVLGPAVQNPFKAHQRESVPAPPPVEQRGSARTVLAVKGSLRRAKMRHALDGCAPFRLNGNRDGRLRREQKTIIWSREKQGPKTRPQNLA